MAILASALQARAHDLAGALEVSGHLERDAQHVIGARSTLAVRKVRGRCQGLLKQADGGSRIAVQRDAGRPGEGQCDEVHITRALRELVGLREPLLGQVVLT